MHVHANYSDIGRSQHTSGERLQNMVRGWKVVPLRKKMRASE